MLWKAGWVLVKGGGKGSHTTWAHQKVTLSGNDGDDASRRQERDVENAKRGAEEAN